MSCDPECQLEYYELEVIPALEEEVRALSEENAYLKTRLSELEDEEYDSAVECLRNGL